MALPLTFDGVSRRFIGFPTIRNMDGSISAAVGGTLNIDVASARLVVEAIVEDLEVKRELFRKLEVVVSDDAILATNTSSLSVTALSAGLRAPRRVVGMREVLCAKARPHEPWL